MRPHKMMKVLTRTAAAIGMIAATTAVLVQNGSAASAILQGTVTSGGNPIVTRP